MKKDTEETTYTIDTAQADIAVLVEEIERLKAAFERHEHKPNGELVLRYNG